MISSKDSSLAKALDQRINNNYNINNNDNSIINYSIRIGSESMDLK